MRINPVRPLITDECAAYRDKFVRETLQPLIELHRARADLSASERAYVERFDAAAGHTTFLDPAPEVLAALQDPVGMIGFVIQRSAVPATTAALLRFHSAGESVAGGTGKSAVAFRLLGIDFKAMDLPWPSPPSDCREIERAINALAHRSPRLTKARGEFRVVTSDMPVVGVSNGVLRVAAPLAEPFLCQWDAARSFARRVDAHYRAQSGEERPEDVHRLLRCYLKSLASCFRFDFGDDGIFVDRSPASYRLDHIFFLDNDWSHSGLPEPIEFIEFEADVLPSRLADQFRWNPAYHYHTSAFWRIDRDEHNRRIDSMMSKVAHWPAATLVRFAPQPDDRHIPQIADMVAACLDGDMLLS